MKNSAKLLVFLILFQILLVSTQEDNFTFLITGGYRPQKHTLVKHIVSIRRKEYIEFFGCMHMCGGSILSPRFVLTAAHCLWNPKLNKKQVSSTYHIVARTPNRLEKTQFTQIIDVEEIFVHPDFEFTYVTNDIGIMRLKTDITEDGVYSQRIELPDGPPNTHQSCTVVGWGTIFEYGPLAADALYVDINVVEGEFCEFFFLQMRSGMICAGDTFTGESDACQGDSGGPLISNGKVIGVVSVGKGCGNLPGIYTDVWYYRNWITTKLKSGCQGRNTIILLMNAFLLTLLVWIFN